MTEYTVDTGKHAARPLIIRPDFGRNPWGAWRLRLGDGWEYDLPGNEEEDWVKLCGDRFGGTRKETVLLGARPGADGKVELSPYYNVRGENWHDGSAAMPDGVDAFPVAQVVPGVDFYFSYRAQGIRVTTCIDVPSWGRVIHRIVHSGIGCLQYEVGFWFGGTLPAPHPVSVWKERIRKAAFADDGGLKT